MVDMKSILDKAHAVYMLIDEVGTEYCRIGDIDVIASKLVTSTTICVNKLQIVLYANMNTRKPLVNDQIAWDVTIEVWVATRQLFGYPYRYRLLELESFDDDTYAVISKVLTTVHEHYQKLLGKRRCSIEDEQSMLAGIIKAMKVW